MSIASTIVGFFCPPAGAAMSVLGKAGAAIGGAAAWIFKTPLHIALAALLLVGGHDARVTWLLGHRDAALARVPAQLAARDTAWSGPFGLMRDATMSLISTVARQNAAVLSLAKDSAARINGQQAALSAATARGRIAGAHVAAIEAEASQRATGARCATGPAIMAAKEIL